MKLLKALLPIGYVAFILHLIYTFATQPDLNLFTIIGFQVSVILLVIFSTILVEDIENFLKKVP
ncbi:MAG: hypothetical protein GY827_04520 [Cytophagales bacterium]|nr:hypothetical protein [Cytophagales bacterium]